jgi:hypothetical protein
MSFRRFAVAAAAVLLVAAPLAPAARATSLAPFIDLQEQGLTIAQAGAGLAGWTGGPVDLTVTVGGTVRFALLYWNGWQQPCAESVPGVCTFSEPYADQYVLFAGSPVFGTVTGFESVTSLGADPALHIGYYADVTSLVAAAGPGQPTFAFADGDGVSSLSQLNGVTLLVGFTDAASTDSHRLLLWDGLDVACAAGELPSQRVVTPASFGHGALSAERSAQLYLVVGGAAAGLPDQVTIANNPTLLGTLDASSGAAWDADEHLVTLPADVALTEVAPAADTFVPGCGSGFWKNHPSEWPPTGYSPSQTLASVFSAISGSSSLADSTLLQALSFPGGNGDLGAARILLRAAVAALLNAAHPDADYPRTVAELIADFDAALASKKRSEMIDLAAELDAANSLGCGLTGSVLGECFAWQVAALRVRPPEASPGTCPGGTVYVGPPVHMNVTFQDPDGLVDLMVTLSMNADTVVPPYVPGTTDPVELTSSKIDQTQPVFVTVIPTDGAGNSLTCEYAF